MFEYLEKARKIFVIGPGRSGTRFIAKCIAEDTGHFYIDEARYCCDSLHHLFSKMRIFERKTGGRPQVIHGPRISRWAHTIADADDVVVFCWRKLEDILASQKKMKFVERMDLTKFDLREGSSAKAAQDFWMDVQVPLLGPRAVEVRFPEDVKRNPRFVPKNERVNWDWNQTEKKL